MTKEELLEESAALLERCPTTYLTTIDEKGFPATRGMLLTRHDGLAALWYIGLSSSRKIGNLRRNNSACVYLWDSKPRLKALALTGTAAVVEDPAVKKELWNDSMLTYYTGPDDPEYCVIRFTPLEGDFRTQNVSHLFSLR